ncbi:hypothetical protein P9112_010137 [Eukaryota sp. TZLM1-RC]
MVLLLKDQRFLHFSRVFLLLRLFLHLILLLQWKVHCLHLFLYQQLTVHCLILSSVMLLRLPIFNPKEIGGLFMVVTQSKLAVEYGSFKLRSSKKLVRLSYCWYTRKKQNGWSKVHR